ncbi:MAG TPA: hypothetical protein VG501_09830 [Rhizomicrobium sp.]|nr:hypothetical protein [Rhizomicrobium sp.]
MKNAPALVLFLLSAATAVEAQAPRGPVHNARAAILMARKIWISLYPAEAAKAGSEKTWLAEEKATRDGDIWEVGPRTPSPAAIGNGLIFRIASDDGHMLGYYNPQ